ncbi:MAG: TolC family protein [Salibacteraceae bacterium]
MKLKVSLFLNMVIIGLIFQTHAQESIDATELVQRILSENYGVKMVRLEEEIAANNNTLGNAGFLPTVDVSGQQSITLNSVRQELANGDLNRGDNARSTSLSAMVDLNWTVFDGFRMFALKDQLGLLQDLGELESKYYIEQTVADAADAFYALNAFQKLLANYEEALEVSSFRYKLEQKKNTIGTSNALLFNQAKSDYLADSALLSEQRLKVRQFNIQLNQWMNDSLEKEYTAQTKSLAFDKLGQKEELIKQSVQSSRDFKRAMIEEMISETQRKIERASRLPEIDLFASYSISRQANEVGFLKSNQNIGPGAGVRIRFNLYNGGNTNRLIKNANLERERQQLNVKSTTQMIEASILQSYYAFNAAVDQLLMAKERESAARKSLEVARQQYEAGAINGFDFRQTQISVLNVSNIVAELEYRIKSIEIELARLSGNILNITL